MRSAERWLANSHGCLGRGADYHGCQERASPTRSNSVAFVKATCSATLATIEDCRSNGIAQDKKRLCFQALSGHRAFPFVTQRSIKEQPTDDRLEIRDSEFVTKVSEADRAVGMEVNRPATISNVRSTLKVDNVREAVGFSTNQGLSGIVTYCPKCQSPVPVAYVGPRPRTAKCRLCGGEIPLN